ncbi:MAG: glutathione S-transferase N-terminal domain-containing protein [Blastocatellia bacterium]|nr:glutathione S-transferase N-terminal domain-containing protein [Blastocatellia bacterium]
MSIEMYMKPDCPYCQKARDYYNENNISFVEYDAQNDKAHQSKMLELSGGDLTVPAIVMNGEYVQSGWGDPLRG